MISFEKFDHFYEEYFLFIQFVFSIEHDKCSDDFLMETQIKQIMFYSNLFC